MVLDKGTLGRLSFIRRLWNTEGACGCARGQIPYHANAAHLLAAHRKNLPPAVSAERKASKILMGCFLLGFPGFFPDMNQTHFKNLFDVVICEGVIDHLALAPVLYEIGKPEGAQLVGYGGLCHAQQGTQIAYA